MPFRILRVAPKLTATSNLPFSGGAYHVGHGKLFTVSGVSNPNMHAAFGPATVIGFQVRSHGARAWHLTTSSARVGKKGRFSVRGEFTGAGTFDLRFRYLGRGGAWATTRSRAIVIKVS
jgi:hypothetical protein